jgi:hypothetical protein
MLRERTAGAVSLTERRRWWMRRGCDSNVEREPESPPGRLASNGNGNCGMKWMAVATIGGLLLTPVLAQAAGAGSALAFEGTGYVSIATTGSLTGTFTVELWANPAENNPGDLLALLGSRTPAEYGFDMKFWLGHLIHGDIGNGFSWLTMTADAEYYYEPGDWVHLAYVVTPTNYSLYANGQWVAGGDYLPNDPILYDGSHQLTIGHIGYGPEYMNGLIDEVRIWSTARDQSEIQGNLQRPLTGSELGLMGYWHFDEGAGPIVNDASGHGFIGLLFNGPAWVNSTAPVGTLVARTRAATAITPSSATLNGTVFPNYSNANAWFEYGTTTNYGSASALIPIDDSSGTPITVSNQITGLTPGRLYHFRLVATNGTASSLGADLTFTASPASLIVNGGFETGNFAGWIQSGYTSENYVATIPLYAHSGSYGASLGPPGSLSYLTQTVPTIPGQTYLISFWLDSPDGLTPNECSVAWDGNSLFDAVDLAATGWTLRQFRTVATSSSTVLQLGFRDDQSYLGLDDVTVVSIPPPDFLPGGPIVINGSLALTWASLAGQIYQLQYSTNLNPIVWYDLGVPITATNAATTAFDPIVNDSKRFYRVVLSP